MSRITELFIKYIPLYQPAFELVNGYLRYLVLVSMIIGCTTSCAIIDPEAKIRDENAFYAINPATILDELAEGKPVFTPQALSPFEASPNLGTPVEWQEADYFRIAEALHELVWDETIQNWTLHKLDFLADCANIGRGLQDARIEYFMNVKTREQESRLVSELIIDPRRSSVVGYTAEYYPQRVRWQEIDLTQLKVSAADALMIAERNGGAATRQSVANECQISILLFPDMALAKYEGWNVIYYPNSGDGLLDVYYVDPVTGELRETK